MKVDGAAALVTGANRGLGAAISQALVGAGAKVYGAARDTTTITNPDVIPVRIDVTSADDIASAASICGDVSIVVNNAGIGRSSASLAPDAIDAARAELETNYFGIMRMAQAFVPVLRENGGGALVNVLSVLSFVSMPQAATYSASKAAAWSLTNALRMELRQQGTLVVAVHAGFIDTDMAAGHRRGEDQPPVRRHPDRRCRRSRHRASARRPDQRDGEGGAGRRPDAALPDPAGPVGRRGGRPMTDVTMRASARFSNLVARRCPALGRSATARQVEKYRSSGGRKGNTIVGRPVFLLDVVGRSSGERRPVMLMHVPRGEDLVVVASAGGSDTTPNWYRNLMAAGGGEVQVGADRWSVAARELDEGPERDEAWALAVTTYPGFTSYQGFTDRKIPVAVLEPRDHW